MRRPWYDAGMNRRLIVINLAIVLTLVFLSQIHAWLEPPREPATAAREPIAARAGEAGPGGGVLLFEGFEGGMGLEVGQGNAFVYGGAVPGPGSDAYWGRSVARVAAGLFSAWTAGAGPNSPSIDYGANCIPGYGGPCPVPPDTNTTMTSGPHLLSPGTTGQLRFDFWLSTEMSDLFSVEASVDGVSFYGFTYYGGTSGFETRALDITSWPTLGDLTGRKVWFRFGYSSDSSVVYEGVFVDNVFLVIDGLFVDGFESGNTSSWSSSPIP